MCFLILLFYTYMISLVNPDQRTAMSPCLIVWYGPYQPFLAPRLFTSFLSVLGTVAEYRLSKQQNIILARCNNPACAESSDNGSIRTADLVCLDPNICSAIQGSPPPCFLCGYCAEILNTGGSSLFVEIVRSIGNIAEVCENPDCTSTSKAGMHFCFSAECTKRNRRKPMRLCTACNER